MNNLALIGALLAISFGYGSYVRRDLVSQKPVISRVKLQTLLLMVFLAVAVSLVSASTGHGNAAIAILSLGALVPSTFWLVTRTKALSNRRLYAWTVGYLVALSLALILTN
jgi:hypothetical protein